MMNKCKCGSYAINTDPDGALCDVCVVKAERDALQVKYLELAQDHGALMFRAAGFSPVSWEVERALLREVVDAARAVAEPGDRRYLDAIDALDAWKRSKGDDDATD